VFAKRARIKKSTINSKIIHAENSTTQKQIDRSEEHEKTRENMSFKDRQLLA